MNIHLNSYGSGEDNAFMRQVVGTLGAHDRTLLFCKKPLSVYDYYNVRPLAYR